MFSELLSEGGLSFDRLASFCLVAEAGGVTKAAKGDPARQSLFSRQIKELEEFFGTELIRRKGRGIVLTEAGQRLRLIARECAVQLTDFRHGCKDRPVEVVIGTGESIIHWVIVPRLAKLRERLPNIRIKLLNLPTSDAVNRLMEGTIDFAIVRKDSVAGTLKTKPLGVMQYSLFVPKSMKMAVPTDIPTLLGTLPLATLEGDGNFRSELASEARRIGVQINVQVEFPSFPAAARAVAKGAVAAILPSIAASDLRDFGVVELPDIFHRPTRRETVLATNPRVLRIRPTLQRISAVLEEICSF